MGNRHVPFQDIIKPEDLESIKVLVVGVGAEGFALCRQLAAMGVTHLSLVDPDKAEEGNMGTQGFIEENVGRAKVYCVADEINRLNPKADVRPFEDRFNPTHLRWDAQADEGIGIVFCCVDNMDARKDIGEACFDVSDSESAVWLFDGRMSAETCVVVSCLSQVDIQYYLDGWFPSSEAHEVRCTARSTIYSANLAACWMIAQMRKALAGEGFKQPSFCICQSLIGEKLEVLDRAEFVERFGTKTDPGKDPGIMRTVGLPDTGPIEGQPDDDDDGENYVEQ